MVKSQSNGKLLLSASAEAIRRAPSLKEALTCFNLRRRGLFPPDEFDGHVAVSIIKSIFSFPPLRHSLTPLLHAYVLKSNLLSNVYVASALLCSYSFLSVDNARVLFDEIPHRNLVTTNTMISCFIRKGDVCSAQLLFYSSPDKDEFSWHAMIRGYMQKNRIADGVSLFHKMLQEEVKPDGALLVTLLSGCAASMRLLCRSTHAYILKNFPEKEMKPELRTSLFTMYMKAGNLNCALSVFNQIPEKNVVDWTAMICGLARHGRADEVFSFWEKMIDSGVKPNRVTFTSFLKACRDASLIEQAQKFFAIMVQEFGLKPRLRHYDCLVNLFAQAGRLEEAYGVIMSMAVEPGILIWTSFLEGCKKYKNLEMAKEGIEKVLCMARPDQHGGVYTLISDLYELGGRSADAERIRQLMDQQKVVKIAGSSSSDVDEKSERAVC